MELARQAWVHTERTISRRECEALAHRHQPRHRDRRRGADRSWPSRIEPRLRRDVERALAARLDSVVTLESFDVELFPRPAISGRGLVIRHRGRTDLPPLITVTSFTGHAGWDGILSRHIHEVTLDGLEITIPPNRRADMPSVVRAAGGSGDNGPPFSIATVTATNARLSILPKRVDKDPRIFDIYSLTVRDLTFVRRPPTWRR